MTFPMVDEIISYMDLRESDIVLDFGCAKGFMVKALAHRGIKACGVDISEYAIKNADPEVKKLVAICDRDQLAHYFYNLNAVIAKDVLEHIPHENLGATLGAFHECLGDDGSLLVVVPLGDESGNYVIPEMEGDDTHIIRKTIHWWRSRVSEFFDIVDTAFSIGQVTKARWRDKYPKGHGFILARKAQE